jgi:hypothetical protein
MLRSMSLVVAFALLSVVGVQPAWANSGPVPTVSGATTDGGFGVTSRQGNGSFRDVGDGPAPVVRVVDCGAPVANGHVIKERNDLCAVTHNSCAGQPATNAAGQPLTTQVTQFQQTDGTWGPATSNCSVVAGAAPGLDPGAVQAQFATLVPHSRVMAAPPTGRAIVNIESLFWVDTPPQRELGTSPLLGHQVTITATVQSVRWSVGDGATSTASTPGRPYTSTDHCDTKQCPDWFGHTYTSTGPMTVSAAVTWTGRYSVDGGPLLQIPGAVTAAPSTFSVQAYEARAVLVPDPVASR